MQQRLCLELYKYTLVRIPFMVRHTQGKISLRTLLEVDLDLLYNGSCLYQYNFYPNPKLDTLCTRKTDIGTMRTNGKEFPDILKRSKLKRGNNSISQETDHEVERQKRCTHQHI